MLQSPDISSETKRSSLELDQSITEKKLTDPEIAEILKKTVDITKPGTMIRYADLDSFKKVLSDKFTNSCCSKIDQERNPEEQKTAVYREIDRNGMKIGLEEYLDNLSDYEEIIRKKDISMIQKKTTNLIKRIDIAGGFSLINKKEHAFINNFLLGQNEVVKRQDEIAKKRLDDWETVKSIIKQHTSLLDKTEKEIVNNIKTEKDIKQHYKKILHIIEILNLPSKEYRKCNLIMTSLGTTFSLISSIDEFNALIANKFKNISVFENKDLSYFINSICRLRGKVASWGQQIPDIGYVLNSDKKCFQKAIHPMAFPREYWVTGQAKDLIKGVIIIAGYQEKTKYRNISEDLRDKLQKTTFEKIVQDMTDYFKDDLKQCVPVYDPFGKVLWPIKINNDYEQIPKK